MCYINNLTLFLIPMREIVLVGSLDCGLYYSLNKLLICVPVSLSSLFSK